jgi:serine/threonine protein kinase
MMRDRIGPYRVLRKLGEGGMGEVYAAHDDRLDRSVAVKLIRQDAEDEQARKRFWREARAAAGLSHPNVCQLHEIGEADGALFIVMELLEGESLADCINRGPLPVSEAVEIGLSVLAALEALHARELVHRDLKPANVFLTRHGVKLLDFGLARAASGTGRPEGRTESQVTQVGGVRGTPRYMAPEQLEGGPTDARADLFSLAALLFEMLSGRPAFGGATPMAVYHATLYEQPPALGGSPAIAAVDRVVRRGLAKSPHQRFPSAAAMAEELRAALLAERSGHSARATPITRLMVLPFRVLRPDADTDFLAFSLPDAITSSLSGLDSLVVRSSLVASRFASESPDLGRLAAEADVDVVLTGTLLRAGDQLRVGAQLVEAPGGAVVWSQTSQVPLRDVFQLQDDLVQRIVASLSLPLTAREHRLLKYDVPASPTAYEFFLRANDLGQRSDNWALARDFYLRCLHEDPSYAPAWARLARIHRLLGKYGEQGSSSLEAAEAAFRRALELNPELSVAHNQYAHLEADLGAARQAMVRLLTRARGGQSDPELFAGLVHVCRYCGLLEASVAADEQARRLEPHIRTSVTHTFFARGDFERCLETSAGDIGYVDALALVSLGRGAEALRALREKGGSPHPLIEGLRTALCASIEGERERSLDRIERTLALRFRDPEALYYVVRHLAALGERERALAEFTQVVEQGFTCLPAFVRDPALDCLRGAPEFVATLQRAEAGYREALAAFVEAGGEQVLGRGLAVARVGP